MKRNKQELIKSNENNLFDKIVTILEKSRFNAVHSINSNIVIAYWSIGKELVENIQKGVERAEYGMQVLEDLSRKLNKQYGKGFSVPNLQNFRKFYLAYPDRISIQYPPGTKSTENKLAPEIPQHTALVMVTDFSSKLSWSHYRALIRVSGSDARSFYEQEAIECGWSKAQLERQIQTSYYERIIANQGHKGLSSDVRKRLPGESINPVHILKSPYVLEFLDLPDNPELHENDIEQAIISNLQLFLLELGKGFSFVSRQKHINFDGDNFYVDLVFYNFILKCFVLIDLKIGKLTHRDVGQMDGYVRLFEDQYKVEGDNPTIGLILCSDKSEAVARYSVLNESKQIFASKYLKYLPSEKELKLELEKERRLIESVLKEKENE